MIYYNELFEKSVYPTVTCKRCSIRLNCKIANNECETCGAGYSFNLLNHSVGIRSQFANHFYPTVNNFNKLYVAENYPRMFILYKSIASILENKSIYYYIRYWNEYAVREEDCARYAIGEQIREYLRYFCWDVFTYFYHSNKSNAERPHGLIMDGRNFVLSYCRYLYSDDEYKQEFIDTVKSCELLVITDIEGIPERCLDRFYDLLKLRYANGLSIIMTGTYLCEADKILVSDTGWPIFENLKFDFYDNLMSDTVQLPYYRQQEVPF